MNRHALTHWELWSGKFNIQEFQDLAHVGQHDLRIKALNKSNTYLTVGNYQHKDISLTHTFLKKVCVSGIFKNQLGATNLLGI